MNINSLLYSLGLSGMFSSRAFLPAFATALMLRYGDSVPFIKNIDLINQIGLKATGGEPTWFTSGWAIGILGILSVVEMIADKSTEMREIMDEFSVYAKTAISGLTSFGVMSATEGQFVEGMVQEAGFLDIFPAFGSAAITFVLAGIRNGTLGILSEADSDDDLGVRGIVSWFEELWASLGVMALLYWTGGMLVLIALTMATLFFIQKRNEKKIETSKIPCSKCGERIHAFATSCHHCSTPVKAPMKLGFLGKLTDETNEDVEGQKLRLIELKRSPLSGERLEKRGVDIACEQDGVVPFKDPATVEAYLNMISGRLPAILGICLILSFIPVLGLIVGVIYYRFKLVAPFRRYLSLRQGIFAKWLIRIFFLLLIAFQWMPGIGGVVVPLMAITNYSFYRSAFKKALAKANW